MGKKNEKSAVVKPTNFLELLESFILIQGKFLDSQNSKKEKIESIEKLAEIKPHRATDILVAENCLTHLKDSEYGDAVKFNAGVSILTVVADYIASTYQFTANKSELFHIIADHIDFQAQADRKIVAQHDIYQQAFGLLKDVYCGGSDADFQALKDVKGLYGKEFSKIFTHVVESRQAAEIAMTASNHTQEKEQLNLALKELIKASPSAAASSSGLFSSAKPVAASSEQSAEAACSSAP